MKDQTSRGQTQGDLRGLKALVGILGVLIIIGTAVVVGTVIHRLYARVSTPPSMAAASPGLPQVTGALVLPAGSHISGLAEAGGEFAVWTSGPAGDALWLVNAQTGARQLVMTAPK